MDIQRKVSKRARIVRRVIIGAVIIAAAVVATVALAHLKPAAPTVEMATLWPDSVKRGDMLREVRGLGTLVPIDIRWIPAVTDGRVERRLVLPGTPVKASTVMIVLSNPQLQQAEADAGWQRKAADAEYNSLRAQLDSQLLDQRATAAETKAQYDQATLQADRDQQLVKLGLGSELTAQLSKSKAEALAVKTQIERERVDVLAKSIAAQLAASKAKVEQLRALYELKHQQVEELQVRAGIDGVLQLLPVDVGQQVTAGTNLARVAQPTRLKAEIKIAETQAKDVQIGQKAEIDTHNGVIPGHVIRIDPSSVNGTRTVDAALDGPLPPGAVPDLSVDGTVQLEHLRDVLYVGRPAFGQPDSTVSLFKVDPDERGATRVQVKFGRSSVNTIEILGGLQLGDKVILSDMQRWDGFDRIRLD